ncbi:MAG: hypothetical protein GPI90_14795 [Microcystis aeruginosa K13-05]|uniref:hypothetical protein n=1 Tax=unclassified Microcystis TaxID=2643300 RepID=UPI0022BAC457|nr:MULTISPECIES: hypothetical protein [unclassified Microcystis]MCZ8050004.1 hypothetical protein [Microcystis sp. LE19-41.2A]MCZ8290052.1 hypothetical protein [Microcystis sp. LE19-59.1C]NCR78529.1 hypothetical protein [Microcystis aeruginosa K13-10]NCR85845.1 hypothetical protein [Microcystis aeruginosa K13-05]
MFTKLNNLWNQFFRRSRRINDKPLNKVSLLVIIIVDIFILVNVFTGLDDISRWHLSPQQVYTCYSEWSSYKTNNSPDRDYDLITTFLVDYKNNNYQDEEIGHLGKVSPICLQYADIKNKLNNQENKTLLSKIQTKQDNINILENNNRIIRSQYDSTLLEKIAGQSANNSINRVKAEEAKQKLEENNKKISKIKEEIVKLKNELLQKPSSQNLLAFMRNESKFNDVEAGYKNATFWYPSIQLGFQVLFLAPLIIVALLVNQYAQSRGYGLIALISWHLLVIFFIPLIFKAFEFLQIGIITQFIFDIIGAIFGGLVFLVQYVYILLIPLFGFAIIKFLQKFVFNTKSQAAKRVQKSQCINCAKTIKNQDAHCPHCGYYQYVECHHCHELTYKNLPYCYHCGTAQTYDS